MHSNTFKTSGGGRYSIPGDWCTVEADGALSLLERGSACINSGDEKIYPEEVEDCLKSHPAVQDALVFGMPDSDWGQTVNAVVQPEPENPVCTTELRDWVKQTLAAYKTLKRQGGLQGREGQV